MNTRTIVCVIAVGLLSACKSAEDYLSDGQDLSSDGKYQAALACFDNSIQKNPFFKDAYIQKGSCYDNMSQYDSAIEVYGKLLEIYPDNTAANYYSGVCRYKQKRFEEAINFYDKALDSKGGFNSSDTASIQAIINFHKDSFESESPEFDIPIQEIIYDRGMAYYNSGQMKNARLDFANCIIRKYNPGTSYYMIGLCRLAINDLKFAREAFYQASEYGDSLAIRQLRSPQIKNSYGRFLNRKKV